MTDIPKRFEERLRPATYEKDAEVHFGVAPPGGEARDWSGFSERLVARLVNLGVAYELDHVSLIDIYDDTRFNTGQCEKLRDELALLAAVVRDPALTELLVTFDRLAGSVSSTGSRLVISGN